MYACQCCSSVIIVCMLGSVTSVIIVCMLGAVAVV